jgi:FSR family fosmidomycin resistance protein-like MFS transporter
MGERTTPSTMENRAFLRERAYVAVASSHFFVDVLNSSRTVLVALLAISLGLSNAQVGIALLLYNVGSALSQPFFGLLADRRGPRWFVAGGLFWMVAMYGLAAVLGGWGALVAITLAGFGSGAVHPAGTMVASESSVQARTQATGFFFASGQTGLFLGPILAGLVLEAFGQPGYLVLPMIALSAVIAAWRWISDRQYTTLERREAVESAPEEWQAEARTLLPLIVVIATSSTIGIAIINFAPKLFADLGFSPLYVGWTAGLYMMGSAVGGITGGTLADRTNRRLPILLGMVGCILPIYFFIPAGDPWRFGLLVLTGFFAGMPHSVLVIMVQTLLPGRRAFASGLTLGLMFFSGAVGSYLLGVVADEIGLAIALQGLIVLPLTAILGTLLLPGKALGTG